MTEVLIGGYTCRIGKGIYRGTLSPETATITDIKPYITLDNASYLAVSNNKFYIPWVKRRSRWHCCYDISAQHRFI